MEGARQFQDRLLRDTNRRVGWAYAGGMRRSTDHSQILFDASCFRIRGATRHYGRGSRPRRTRGNCMARWTETLMVAIAFGSEKAPLGGAPRPPFWRSRPVDVSPRRPAAPSPPARAPPVPPAPPAPPRVRPAR